MPPYWQQTTEWSSVKTAWKKFRELLPVLTILQDPCPYIQLLHEEGHAPCQWNLATDQDDGGAPGDQVWDLLCVQLAIYLEEGPLMWMMPLHLFVNQKSDYYDDDDVYQ